MDNHKQIKFGAVISYVAIFINILATLFYTPWMKNQIGMSNYGLFTLANSFISMFLMDFGIGSSVARFLAKYRAEKNDDAIKNLMGWICKIFAFIDAIIFAVLFVLYFFLNNIYIGLTPDEREILKILYVIMAGFSVISFPFTTLSGVFNAYEKFVPLKLFDLGQKLLSIVCIVTALLCGGDVNFIVLGNSLSGMVFIIVKLIYIKKRIPVKINFKVKDKALLKEIFSFSIWVMVLGIAQRFTYNIAPSILGTFANSNEIALYSPASSIAGYFYTFATAINGLFLPTVSRKIAENKEEDILPLMIKVGRFQVCALGLLFAGFVSVGKDFIVLWMGKEFEVSYYCTVFLALPTIFEYSQQIANTAILAKNKVACHAMGVIATSVINLIISPFLSKAYGSFGASIAICIIAFLNLIYLNVLYYKALKINVFKFYKSCYLPIIIPIVATIAVSLFLNYFIKQCFVSFFILKGIIIFVLYAVLVATIFLKKEERTEIFSKFKFGKSKNE